jgi:hypothetical protein
MYSIAHFITHGTYSLFLGEKYRITILTRSDYFCNKCFAKQQTTPITKQESHKLHEVYIIYVGDLKFLPFKTWREEQKIDFVLVIVGIFSGVLVAVIVYFIYTHFAH